MVDDHVLIREALRDVLKELRLCWRLQVATKRMQVVAEHPNLKLILFDLNQPDCDGFSMLTELGERYSVISWWYHPPTGAVAALLRPSISVRSVSFPNRVSALQLVFRRRHLKSLLAVNLAQAT